jgi:hypothetical protein
MTNPLQFCVTGETAEIVDRLLDEFVRSCIGKNDMSVVSGFITSAAILIATHCERTGEDFQELSDMCRDQFDLALKISGEHVIKGKKR